MNPKDKEYIDRQYNQLNDQLANLKNYLQGVAPSGPAKVELDRSYTFLTILLYLSLLFITLISDLIMIYLM